MAKKSKAKSPKPKVRRRRAVPGPKPSITLDVVKRVAARYGMGVPLVDALAAEGHAKINLETWKKAMGAHPEFSPHWEAARGKFLADAMRRLVESGELENLRWLLPRRYPELFAAPAPVAVNVSNTTIVELPADIVERAREYSNKTKGTDGTK